MKFNGDHLNCKMLILTNERPHMSTFVFVLTETGRPDCALFSTVSHTLIKSLCHEILQHVTENHYQMLTESFLRYI
jgi:hypothetical protein